MFGSNLCGFRVWGLGYLRETPLLLNTLAIPKSARVTTGCADVWVHLCGFRVWGLGYLRETPLFLNTLTIPKSVNLM